jgi:hypothetical protein
VISVFLSWEEKILPVLSAEEKKSGRKEKKPSFAEAESDYRDRPCSRTGASKK